jgi:hypothetical protein
VGLWHLVAYIPQTKKRAIYMTSNHCSGDILKSFKRVLDSLTMRNLKQDEPAIEPAEHLPPGQSIRGKTSRQFHIWDRVKESIKSPYTMREEVRTLAETLVPPIKRDEQEPLPSPAQLAKSRSALARAKTTSSRLTRLESHLNQ